MILEKLNTIIPYYVFGHHKPSQEEMRYAIISVSDLFTFHEEERPFQYFARKEVLKGYLLYFFPISLNKIYLTLKEALRHPALRPKKGNLNILDIGCGITPSILAFLELYSEQHFPGVHLDYTGIDADPNALKIARDLMQTLIPPEYQVNYRFLKMDLCKEASFAELKKFHPHFLIMSNSLGEIVARGTPLMNLANKLGTFILENNSIAVLIEPGTKKASQRLHHIRDFFIREYQITPYSPCPHRLPCPALKNKNWCYEEWPWESPDYL
ncbi:MAG: small ribosomal subunit Rsm22 family protein, partial [Atribacterota bacterium]|nr:small ribosomal subunit Rsm22 family protein [Atribacterota bacterium]